MRNNASRLKKVRGTATKNTASLRRFPTGKSPMRMCLCASPVADQSMDRLPTWKWRTRPVSEHDRLYEVDARRAKYASGSSRSSRRRQYRRAHTQWCGVRYASGVTR